jgi:hypothetical protein
LLSLVTAALDDRVDAAVVAGFLTSYRGGLVERFACPCQFGGVLGGAYDVADIAAMRAPAPLMFVAGRMDGDIPFAEQQAGFQRIFEVWSALGAERAAAFVAHDGGHEYLAAPAAAFFETHLIRTDVD